MNWKKLNALIELTLPKHYLISILVFISGLVITTKSLPLTENFLLLIILSLIVAGFNAFNAVFDLEIDKINKPYRPLPSKKITSFEAFIFSLFLFIFSFSLSFLANNFYVTLLVLINIILVVLYSIPKIRLKDKFLGANLVIGFHYGIIPLLLAWVIYKPFESFSWALGLSVFLFAFAITFCKDFSDYAGDKKHKVKTLPVVFGIKKAAHITSIYLIFSFLFIIFLTYFGFFRDNMFSWAIMIFPLGILIKSLVKDPEKKAVRIFKISTLIYVLGIILIALLML